MLNFSVFWDTDLSLAVDDQISASQDYDITVTCTNNGQTALTADFTLTIESPCDNNSLTTSINMPNFIEVPIYLGPVALTATDVLLFTPAICM